MNKAAKKFGGGGHRNAAGCTIEGGIDEVRNKMVEAVEGVLDR